MNEPLELTVSEQDSGRRLDVFLAGPLGSRSQAQSLIEAGQVLVDGHPRPKRHPVATGERVVVSAAEAPTESGESDARFTVVYEDEHLLVVDKPAGVVVHPARGHWSGTLSQALTAFGTAGGEPGRVGIVHRLDRDTSGLLVVARDEAVHRRLKQELADRRLRREYLALVDGHPEARTGTIDAPIGRDRRDRLRMSIDTDAPREARTHFELERRLPTSALLRVTLETGRTHQIRVHMAAIGHPVAGDPQYGTPGEFGLERQFLHAARLAFTHPVTGVELDLRSELPEDLSRALAVAERAG